MSASFWLRFLWLWILLLAAPFVLQAVSAYDAQNQTTIAYDYSSNSGVGYDAVSVLATGEKENGTIGNGVLFAKFAEFLAAETTASLARSPWPGNSGFIEGTVERQFLMPGEVVDRYGFGGGRFVSPAGTSVEARALRAGTENLPFNSYQVVKPIEVNAGGVQPWFGQPGLGTQYELPVSVNVLLKRGFIQPVTP